MLSLSNYVIPHPEFWLVELWETQTISVSMVGAPADWHRHLSDRSEELPLERTLNKTMFSGVINTPSVLKFLSLCPDGSSHLSRTWQPVVNLRKYKCLLSPCDCMACYGEPWPFLYCVSNITLMRLKCPIHLIPFYLIPLITSGEEQKTWSCFLYGFLLS